MRRHVRPVTGMQLVRMTAPRLLAYRNCLLELEDDAATSDLYEHELKALDATSFSSSRILAGSASATPSKLSFPSESTSPGDENQNLAGRLTVRRMLRQNRMR